VSPLPKESRPAEVVISTSCPSPDLQEEISLYEAISENPAGVRRLCQSVIIQAARDAAKGKPGAADFLVDPDTAETWLEWAHFNRPSQKQAIYKWVQAGCDLHVSANGRGFASDLQEELDEEDEDDE
jgi:hypothetical protein